MGGEGGDWQELGQSVVIGLIFSFLVAKLISTVLSFRRHNLNITRQEQVVEEEDDESRVFKEEGERGSAEAEPLAEGSGDEDDDWEGVESSEIEELFSAATAFVAATAADRNSAKVSTDLQLQLYGFYKIATEGPCTQPQPSALKVSARAKWYRSSDLYPHQIYFLHTKYRCCVQDILNLAPCPYCSVRIVSHLCQGKHSSSCCKCTMDLNWKAESHCTCCKCTMAFVAATAADRNSAKVSTDLQLQLYGFYKIATEGPCTQPQPSALKVSARAKWNAWQKLDAMPPEEAMENYITIVSELYPSWADGSTKKHKGEGFTSSGKDAKGPMGPVFSSFIYEEESDNDLTLDDIHVAAREGEADKLLMHIDNGVSVNLRDSEGRTPLHWAVDRGYFNVAEILLQRNADVNAKDDEGQTPLHYAAVCEREAIAKLLVKHNADPGMKDVDGNSPGDLCSSSQWAFMASL